MNQPSRRFRRAAIACVAAGLLLAAAVCAGAASSADASALAGVKPSNLTVGIPSPSPSTSDFYWALEQGIFAKLGLNVYVVSQGTIEATNLAAGRLVVGEFGATGMFPAIEAGRASSIIYMEGTGNASGSVVVKSDSDIHTVMDLSGASVGVVGASGSSYGAAQAYSAYIKRHGGKPLNVIVEPTSSALTASVESGQIAAAIFTPVFGSAIAAGLLRQIVSSDSALAQGITGKGITATAFFGTKKLLQTHRVQINRLVAGLRIARKQIGTATDAQVAAVLAKNSVFSPSVLATSILQGEVTTSRPFWAQDGGFIDAPTWKKSLQAFGNWGLNLGGLNIDLTSDQFNYQSVIDMSYWRAATPLVNGYLKTHK